MKPINLKTWEVQAILDNRKTVTRRAMKPQQNMVTLIDGIKFPYRPGEILYVQETWQYAYDLDGNYQPIDGTGRYLYAADGGPEQFGFWVNPDGTHRYSMPFCPSIHMPREAARIFLRVTDVHVERLQDITESQAMAEGCNGEFLGTGEAIGCGWKITPQDEFSSIWNSTIKSKDRAIYGWEGNPWVWVIEFEIISKEEVK